MLPKPACPACWPAYAGLLSSIGLGFLISAVYLLPLTLAFLVLALGALAFRANKRNGYRPFLVGLFGALGTVVSKFLWESNYILYGALGLLVVASVWNSWPRHTHSEKTSCPDCEAKPI
jgi:hypothetical protein